MKSRNQLMEALRQVESYLLSEYELRAQVFTDDEPIQDAMRNAINVSRTARGQEKLEAHDD